MRHTTQQKANLDNPQRLVFGVHRPPYGSPEQRRHQTQRSAVLQPTGERGWDNSTISCDHAPRNSRAGHTAPRPAHHAISKNRVIAHQLAQLRGKRTRQFAPRQEKTAPEEYHFRQQHADAENGQQCAGERRSYPSRGAKMIMVPKIDDIRDASDANFAPSGGLQQVEPGRQQRQRILHQHLHDDAKHGEVRVLVEMFGTEPAEKGLLPRGHQRQVGQREDRVNNESGHNRQHLGGDGREDRPRCEVEERGRGTEREGGGAGGGRGDPTTTTTSITRPRKGVMGVVVVEVGGTATGRGENFLFEFVGADVAISIGGSTTVDDDRTGGIVSAIVVRRQTAQLGE